MILFTVLLGILFSFGLIIITILNSMLIIGIYYFFIKRVRAYLSLEKELNEKG
ncbi:hypothetical protein MCO_00602 [Bartonella sp. DB5-6]|uniref:hypothetical protein n=1 Tax=Bartonella sp. DB5-6 TaxID=1094755 RepID=UPI00026E9156|nr:hypothetical protein [Bartonella sp. DB5-6]EJF78617.1 hypothetical protein MCO_00602 [Bartonella sp. DB5-6]